MALRTRFVRTTVFARIPGVKILIILAVSVAAAAAQSPKTNPLAGNPKAAEEGRVAFRGSCSLCHGIKGEGGRGPDLTASSSATGASDADLYAVRVHFGQLVHPRPDPVARTRPPAATSASVAAVVAMASF